MRSGQVQKASGVPKQYLPELIKCAKDPVYFLNTYCKILTLEHGIVPFELYDFQIKCIKDYQKHRFNINCKSRQLGLSTVTAGYALWKALFQRNQTILCIATKNSAAVGFIKKVKEFWKNLPKWLQFVEYAETTQEVRLGNGSIVEAVPTSDDAGRGKSINLLIVDEAAHIKNFGTVWTSIYPALSTGGNAIIISCVTDETYVYTDKGVQQVKDFIENNGNDGGYSIEPYNIQGHSKKRTGSLFVNNGFVDTKIIATKYGNIEGSLAHKLWACKNNTFGWYKLDELEIGDWVSHYSGQNVWGNNDNISDIIEQAPIYKNNLRFDESTISDDFCYLMGLYIAEGSSGGTSKEKTYIDITCGDDISKAITDTGLSYTFNQNDRLHYRIGSKNLIQTMNLLGFDLTKQAYEKEIPKRFLSMSKQKICSLLSGLFDGDGCARTDSGFVSYASTSKKLIQQISVLLSNIGILSSVYRVTAEKMNSYNPKIPFNFDSYRLELNGKNSIKFHNEIGFRFKRKQILSSKIGTISKNNSHDVIPNSLPIVMNLCEQYKLTNKKTQKFGINLRNIGLKTNRYKTQNLSKDKVVDLINYIENHVDSTVKEEYSWVNENVTWAQIKSVDFSKSETYDFSLPDNDKDFWSHSIVYNNFLGHQTPNGVGNQYYDIWVGAESKTNTFHATKLPWNVHPDHDDEWFANETKSLSKRMIAQEFLCEFIGSGDTFLQTDQMIWLSGKTKQPIKYDPIEKELWLWEDPVPGSRYLIAADVSRGDSKDFSAFHIMNVDTGYVIGEYQGKVTPDLFAGILFRVGNQYNRALIIVESNSYGNHTLIELKKANYSNIYYHGTPKALIGNYVPKHTDKMGFFTGTENRLAALTSLEECLRLEKIIPCSVRVYNEFQTFIWSSDKKPQAIKGKTDDLVMSLAIAAWCFKQYYDTGSIKKDKSNNSTEFYIGFSNKPMTPERNHLNSMLPSIGKNHLKTPIQTDLDPNDIRWLIS